MSKARNILGKVKGAAARLFDGPLRISDSRRVKFDPLTLDGLTVACRAHWPDDESVLARQWDALCDTSPNATAFHRRAWQQAVCATTAAGQPLRVVNVHKGAEMIAVLPFLFGKNGKLEAPGEFVSDYLDPLIRPGAEATACRAVLHFLRGLWDRRVSQLIFHNLRADAPCRTALLAEAANAGFVAEETLVANAPAIVLPSSWDGFLDSLDTHNRKELRRKLNKAWKQGAASLIECRTESQIAASVPKAIELMALRGGEKEDAVKIALAPLLTSVAPAMIRQGHLELLTLEITGQPAACLLQFPSRCGPMLYNCGVDYAFKEWSPGVVAVALAIQRAIANGAAAYDMLRGQETYKYRFGAKDRAVYRIVMKVGSGRRNPAPRHG